MRIARVPADTATVMAIVEGDDVYEAEVDGQVFADLPALLVACSGNAGRIAKGARFGALNQTQLLAPVARPRKIICIGLNYRRHAEEVGLEIPKAPPIFAKWDNAIAGPYDDVVLPPGSKFVDWESELTVVIGRRCKDVAEAEAGSVIFGYTCANDVSARDWQNETSQWGAGKCSDGFAPLGPWVVTVDELGASPDVAIRGYLDGELMQNSRTSDFIYNVPQLIAFLTRLMTLEPGDLILTGTPEGVGVGRRPRRSLKPGESYTVEIEGIGSITNRFVAG